MKLFRLAFAGLLTFAAVALASATVNRQLPTSTTDPGGLSGTSYADQVAEEVEALWRIGVEPLTSVSGTNAVTATPAISGSGFAAYETGNSFSLIPANTNTGAVTIDIAGRGAKNLKDASGADLDAGALVAGALYTISYDGTDFRVVNTPDVEIGAKIHALTGKTTPADADELVISDGAASNAGKKVTFANLRTALNAGQVLIDEDEPTSDVSSISQTGLSAYRDVTVAFGFQYSTSGAPTVSFQARASGGTWRTIYSFTGGGPGFTAIGSLTIRNFGRANNVKMITGTVYENTSSNTIDRSSALVPGSTTSGSAVARMATWNEKWDEFQVTVNTSSIEGSNSDARAYVAYWGEGEGD